MDGGGLMKEEIGRIVVKTAGREASKKCVIVSVVDKNFVLVTGPKSLTGVKRRRVNVSHLAFTPHKIDIKENASDDEVLKKLEEAGLIDYMREYVRVHPKALPLTTS
jgi:large subunit ribosomal protein L14e